MKTNEQLLLGPYDDIIDNYSDDDNDDNNCKHEIDDCEKLV